MHTRVPIHILNTYRYTSQLSAESGGMPTYSPNLGFEILATERVPWGEKKSKPESRLRPGYVSLGYPAQKYRGIEGDISQKQANQPERASDGPRKANSMFFYRGVNGLQAMKQNDNPD